MPSVSFRAMSMLLFCLVFGGAAEPMKVPAASAEYLWQIWNREHGLPMGRIQAIVQTRDGYLWVGTAAGVARFDGRHWQVFNRANMPDLPADSCAGLVEDLEGNLWAEFNEGLFRWNGRAFEKLVWPEPPENKPVLAMCASRSGGLWVIAEPGLWLLRNGQRRTFPLVEAAGQTCLPDVAVTSLQETEDGLWIGRARGLMRFDASTERFIANQDFKHLPPPQFVLAVAPDHAGVHWVLHLRGHPFMGWLSPFAEGFWRTNSALSISNGARIFFLFRERQGTLWFPNNWGRIASLREGQPSDVLLPGAAAEDFVLTMGDDREGGLWLGTEGNRLLRFQPKRVRTIAPRDGLPHDNAWSIFEARDGSIWIGTDGGVSRLHAEQLAHYTEREGLSRNTVRAFAEDTEGRIWIGTGAGLNWMENGKVSQFHFPGPWFNTKVRALLYGRNHTLWLGTARGLHCLSLNQPEGKPLPFTIIGSYNATNGLPHDDVRALLEDRRGNLWIGTWTGGLYRFRDGAFQPHALPNEFAGDSAWALHEDAEGALWVGTEHGLARLKAGRWKAFTPREGLPEDSINHILEDNLGQLWLGGERGIYRLNKRALDDVADGRATTALYVAYDEDEGMLNRETNGQKNQPGAIRSRDGRLWFATTRGVAIFDPKHLPDQTNPPPVVIEQIYASGESIFNHQPGQSATFPLRAGAGRILEIHYTANTFVAADKVRFKYRLAGLDREWIEAGTRRVAQYANLEPGDYRFQVHAMNKYGVWNEAGAAFAFRLAPFLWQTTWFRAAVVLFLILAGYGCYRRISAQHRRRAEAERRLAVSTERADIARDLHDHLGARLTLVQHLTQALDHGASANGNGAQARQKLTELARELNASLDSAVWAVQPDKDTLASLADYLGDTFQELLAGTEIELELDFPDPLPPWPLSRAERYHLALIAVEALNNVLKHARATAVRLRLDLVAAGRMPAATAFTLSIIDNGCGFATAGVSLPASRGAGNGLANMRQRIEKLGGQFELTSEPGLGTAIAITLVPSGLRDNANEKT